MTYVADAYIDLKQTQRVSREFTVDNGSSGDVPETMCVALRTGTPGV